MLSSIGSDKDIQFVAQATWKNHLYIVYYFPFYNCVYYNSYILLQDRLQGTDHYLLSGGWGGSWAVSQKKIPAQIKTTKKENL